MIGYIVDCILSLLKFFNNVETVEHNPYLFHVIFVLFLNRIRTDIMTNLMDHANCFLFENIFQLIDYFFNIFTGVVFVFQFFEDVMKNIDEVEYINNAEWIVKHDVKSCHKFV